MAKHRSSFFALLPPVAVLAVLVIFNYIGQKNSVVQTQAVKTQSTPPQERQQLDPTVEAVRRGDFKEAARLKGGHYVGYTNTTGWLTYDVESLTSHSSTIVMGSPIEGSSSIVDARIRTEYRVRVEKTFKGTANSGDLVTLVVPVGKVTFDDGTSAEIKAGDLGPIIEHRTYFFFLHPSQKNPDVLALTGGGEGVFEAAEDKTRIVPLSDRSEVQRHKNQKVSEFSDEIEAAVRKHPNTLPYGK